MNALNILIGASIGWAAYTLFCQLVMLSVALFSDEAEVKVDHRGQLLKTGVCTLIGALVGVWV